MGNKIKLNLSANNIISSVLYAVIGVLLIVLRSGSLGILMTAIGAMLIALGIIDAFKNNELVMGIAQIVIGVVLIIGGWTVTSIILLIFGILLIIKGAMDLFKNYRAGYMPILSAIITIVIGVLLVISKWALLDVMCIVAGVIFIVNAILVLFGNNMLEKK